jgi:hypothetical protein
MEDQIRCRSPSELLPPSPLSAKHVPSKLTRSRRFGQNLKQTKLNQQLGDVQVQMRLEVSGDKHEIRQSYIPALFPHIVKPLVDVGAVCLVCFLPLICINEAMLI